MVPHGMSSSAVVRPSAASPAKNDSDQAVPLLSKSSWVDHIGVVDAVADIAVDCTAVVFASAREAAVETAIRLPATVSAAAAQVDGARPPAAGDASSVAHGVRFFRNETDRGSVESSTGAPVRSRSWLGLGLLLFAGPFAQL